MEGLLEGSGGGLQLTLQQPVAALQLPDQLIRLQPQTQTGGRTWTALL